MNASPNISRDVARAVEEFPDAMQAAFAIADDVSVFDIECGLSRVLVNAGEFFDLHLCLNADMRTRLARAIRYLGLRGRIEWHPTYANLFRINDEPAPGESHH